jgi:hypothetical protein
MDSILLGALALSGNNTKPQTNTINNGNKSLDLHSNIESAIKMIEKQQVGQNYSRPEFLNQFDELTFDTVADPVSVNQSNITVTGMNRGLQRNLDFHNGYSEFQKTDMHYDVVSQDHFTHNNMTLRTSRRDFSINPERTQRSLELFTGQFSEYTPKKEKVPLFEPMSDLTWVNGMPAQTANLANRYIPSNKNNNGNLPFQYNMKVKPGLEFKNQEGNYAVYRVDPRNVDELRSEINQKVSYKNKPLETAKKGDIRAPDFNLTKFKLPDFRIQTPDDFVATRAEMSGGYQSGKFTNVETTRNTCESYQPGPAVQTTRGSGPDCNKSRFEPAKKESFVNDNTHAVNGINNKPVMTNAKAYCNVETQRASTSIQYEGNATNTAYGNYTVDYKSIANPTIRQTTVCSSVPLGVTSGEDRGKTYVFSKDMVLPVTNRQTMTCNNPVLGVSMAGNERNGPTLTYTDDARRTIRETTSAQLIASGAVGLEKKNNVMVTDTARQTIRETTSAQLIASGAVGLEKKNNVLYTDEARPTIRETTSTDLRASGAVGLEKKNNVLYSDDARPTIRETTSVEVRATGATNIEKMGNLMYTDIAKPTIKESTEATQYIGTAVGNRDMNSMYVRDMTEIAKPTIRQSTEATQYIGTAVGNRDINSMYVRDITETAKPTIRQSTEATQYIGTAVGNRDTTTTYVKDYCDVAKPTIRQTVDVPVPVGHATNSDMGSYSKDYCDVAKPTMRQSTLLENYTGGLSNTFNNEAKVSHEAASNMEIDERREITTYNRAANGKKDLNGPYINRETVHLNEPLLYSYVPAPLKPLDSSIMPRVCKETIETQYKNSRPTISTSSYYISNNRINTLKDNPLVNDLYHQKNVSFN